MSDITRRSFIKQGLATTAGASLLGTGMGLGKTHFPSKIKNVIYMHMAGGPTQLDLFDYKPELIKRDGENSPDEYVKGKTFAFTRGIPKLQGTPQAFKQHGQTGSWFSAAIPHMASVSDELTFIKSMTTDQFNHGPAQQFLHTGFAQPGRPCIGAWVNYALGTENSNLPGFVVFVSGGSLPSAGKEVWGSGFLPSVYQGVRCRSKGDPVLYIKEPKGVSRDLRRISLDGLNELNKIQHKKMRHPETKTRMSQYELAYRMGLSVPEVMDLNKEKTSTLEAYGAVPGAGSFANNCLLARKLVEKGVRFVQLYDWGWDFHGTNPKEDIGHGLVKKCAGVDRPVAALIRDLKSRGLLDETLIIWGGEFGRTPFREGRTARSKNRGRDHYPNCFTIMMAGGGLKPGSYGSTTELGFGVAENKVHVHDYQATILHLLGFDHEKLSYRFQGRDFRLTDVHGHVVKGILS